MPAIRDFAVNYTSSTSDTGVICAAPDAVAGDLLLALLSADSGTQVWSGGDEPGTLFTAYTGGTVFANITTAATNDTTGDVFPLDTTPAVNDATYYSAVGGGAFKGISLLNSTQGAGTWTLVWEYWNGTAWTAFTPVIDTIASYRGTTGYKRVTWNVFTDWTATTVNAVSALWARSRVSAYTSITTRPACTRVYIETWQQLFSATNTVNHGFLYKIVGAVEGAQHQFSYGTAETANSAVISIRDVDTKLPFATTTFASYASTNVDSDQALNNTTTRVSQSVLCVAGQLASVSFWLKKVGSATGNAVAKMYTHSGVMGTSSVPTGVALAASDPYDVSALTTSYQLIEFTFPWQYTMTATNFCFTLEYTGTATDYIAVGYDASAAGASGNKATYTGAAWTAQATQDCCYYVQRFTYTTGTATAAKSNLPTMTTSRNNSLILWAAANAGTGTTTLYNTNILEGPCTFLFGKDGTGHSDCAAWGFQKTAGTTAAAVGQSNMGTGTQTITTSVLAVNPPATGATVIPGYCVSDASIYVSPMTGAAYNSDAAPVNTVTSSFGTSLNGKTLATGGTTYTRADTGINPYHAMANCLGLSTANRWSGNRVVFAAAKNFSGKNVLIHMQPYLPLDIQTTDSVALSGTMGVAVGFASTANTHYRVWHVGGANSSWGIQRHAPIIVNPSYAGAGRIQNTGTLVDTAVLNLGVMVSCKVVAANWLFGSVWALDTTVVAGGNAAEPLGIKGMISAAADGKERRSIIAEGSSQFMIFGPIQVGDGQVAADTYLNLDGTALEFPQQYNQAAKNVSYCSIDNVCGLKYYAGATDTIKHKNSVISSASRYFWGLHASSSTAATYDFSGLSVIGAGTITLGRAITITGLTINDYVTLDASGLTLTYSTIKAVPAANDSITVTAATNIDYCNINTSTVTSSNHWVTCADPSIFTYTAFTGGTGHAIMISTPGTYTFTGNTFTGYAATDGSTGNEAIYNNSGGLVTLNLAGGGTTPSIRNGAGASTVVNNSVPVTVTVVDKDNNPIATAQVGVYVGTTAVINTDTDALGVATTSYAGSTPANAIWKVRKSSTGSTKYIANSGPAVIASGTGMSVKVVLLVDPNA